MLAPVPPPADREGDEKEDPRVAGPERLEPLRDETNETGSGWNEREAVRTAAAFELPADLLATGVTRLGGIAASAALVLGVYMIGLAIYVPSSREWGEVRTT